MPIRYEVDPDHQALSTDLADRLTAGRQSPELILEVGADLGGVRHEALVKEVEGGQGRGTRHRVAADRRRVRTRSPVHEFGARHQRTHRQA